MNENKFGEYDDSIEQIVARSVELDREKFPNLQDMKSIVLREGKRAYKVAKYWTILDEHTGKVRHHSLNLATYDRTKKSGWLKKADKSITLDDDNNDDEIQKLLDFLATLPNIQGDASYSIIRQDDERIGRIIDAIQATDERKQLVEQILSWIDTDSTATEGLIQLSIDNPIRSKSLAAALNYGRYSQALEKFRQLVEADASETTYQKFLEGNNWIFGSEYSELLSFRDISNGVQLDFPMRRTLDGYLEVIEIKKPLTGKPLFIGDKHLYPRSEVNEAVAQANHYLQIIERDNYRIQSEFGILVDKVRARVVIGRNGDKSQQEALRLHNSNQKQVEVITYDQLIQIGEIILQILAEENSQLHENLNLTESVSKNSSKDYKDIPF